MLVICAINPYCSAQSLGFEHHYTPIYSKGQLPPDLTKLSSQIFAEETSKIEKTDTDRKDRKKFLLSSSFNIRKLLASGMVIFNDTVSQYINDVAAKILTEHTDLKKKLRFYLVKSPAVNAFTSNDGIIFVNIGLIAQIENEAQLAFILAHEIAHYTKKHVIEGYIENEKISSARGIYSKKSPHELLIVKNHHSQEVEFEADLHGFNTYFANSGYDLEEGGSVFDVLKYSYLPFDEVPFNLNIFDNKYIQYFEKYFPEETNAINAGEDYNEALSTHPSPEKRQTKILEEAAKKENIKGKNFLLPKSKFEHVQQVCRFELCKLYNDELALDLALYHNWLMLNKYPQNKYVKKQMGRTLYLLSHTKPNNQNDVIRSTSNVEGQSHRVTALIEELSDEEIAMWALSYLWHIDPKQHDKDIEKWQKSIAKLLKYDYDVKTEQLLKEESTSFDSLSSETYAELSKIEKIKYDNKLKESEDKVNSVLVNAMNDPNFESFFNDQPSDQKEEKELTYKEKVKKEREISRNGRAFGIDKMIVISPEYQIFNYRSKNQNKRLKSERKQLSLSDKIKYTAEELNMKVEVLDDNSFKNSDAHLFNCYVEIQQWLRMKGKLENMEISIPILQDSIYHLLHNEFDTDHCSWMGFYTMTSNKPYRGLILLMSIVYWPALPYGIYYMVTPEKNTYYYLLTMNLENEEADWFYFDKINKNDSNSLVNFVLKDCLHQIHRKPSE